MVTAIGDLGDGNTLLGTEIWLVATIDPGSRCVVCAAERHERGGAWHDRM